jgi:hypothetical protein
VLRVLARDDALDVEQQSQPPRDERDEATTRIEAVHDRIAVALSGAEHQQLPVAFEQQRADAMPRTDTAVDVMPATKLSVR